MSNNKDFKVKAGIQPTSYFEGVGTVVSGSVPAGPADVSAWSYDSVSFSTGTQDSQLADIAFNSDGTKMYMVGSTTDNVYQYSLSTAFDVSTASYDSVSFSVASQDAIPQGLTFSNDGTRMFMVGYNSAGVHQYNLSTAFDLSTASYDNYKFSVIGQDSFTYGITFKPDGTKMYIVGAGNKYVYQYSLFTAFNVRTASYDNTSFYLGSQDASPQGVAFNNTGTKMYLIGQTGDDVNQYTLSTAFDVGTASFDNATFSVASQSTSPNNLIFNNDYTKMYVASYSGDRVYQYSTDFALTSKTLDLSTGSVFEVTPTSDIQVTLSNPADSGTVSGATLLLEGVGVTGFQFDIASYDDASLSVASEEANPDGLAFNNDNTKLFVTGISSDSIHQYNLSVASDISTATYSGTSFSFTHPSANTRHIVFKPDGTKLFVMDVNDSAYQYSLSTAFDISTLSYDSVSFSFTSQDSSPTAIRFNNDGTKMYMSGTASDRIYQYSLSTAFNIGTASYDSLSLLVSGQETSPNDLYFNADGSKLFVIGDVSDYIYQYNLSTPFAINTGSYSGTSLSLNAQETGPFGLTFNSDGTKMYYAGRTNDTIYQYSTASPATITYDTSIEWPSGTAPTSPAIGETDVITFNTRDGGSTYQGVLAIDGAS